MSKVKKQAGQYAVWSYDQFPFLLGGVISKVLAGGRVEIHSYGPGFSFYPIKVFPLKKGLAFQDKLNELTLAHQKAQEDLNLAYRSRLTGLLLDNEIDYLV